MSMRDQGPGATDQRARRTYLSSNEGCSCIQCRDDQWRCTMGHRLSQSAFLVLTFAACLASSDPGHTQQLRPEAREYKLMLAPEKFSSTEPADSANELWNTMLKAIIARVLDKGDNGKPRHKGSFDDFKQRHVTFRDTPACVLNSHGYTLRERVKVK